MSVYVYIHVYRRVSRQATRSRAAQTAVERIRHILDSQAQILALAFR